jgi:hypothetical protein
MHTLVRWAVKCDSAEQLGERLKRRYDRQLQRRGLARPGGRALDRLGMSPQENRYALAVTTGHS